jgi:hypothetical protein
MRNANFLEGAPELRYGCGNRIGVKPSYVLSLDNRLETKRCTQADLGLFVLAVFGPLF